MNNKSGKPKSNDKDKRSSSSPRIVTLDSIRNNEESDRQAFFAGGSLTSGQQILGNNPNSSHFRDQLLTAFRAASIEIDYANAFYQQNEPFSGVGYMLGSTATANDDQSSNSHSLNDQSRPIKVTLRLWENGYSIDDGPINNYDGQNSNDIINEILEGLNSSNQSNSNKGSIDLTVIDITSQQYRESVSTFGGTGHILGSLTPSVTSNLPKMYKQILNKDIEPKICDRDGSSTDIEVNIDRQVRTNCIDNICGGTVSNVDEQSGISNTDMVSIDIRNHQEQQSDLEVKGPNQENIFAQKSIFEGNEDIRLVSNDINNEERISMISDFERNQMSTNTSINQERMVTANPIVEDYTFASDTDRISSLLTNENKVLMISTSQSETNSNVSEANHGRIISDTLNIKDNNLAIAEKDSQSEVNEVAAQKSKNSFEKSAKNSFSSTESAASQISNRSTPQMDNLPDGPLSEEFVSSIDFDEILVDLDPSGNFGGVQGYLLGSDQNIPPEDNQDNLLGGPNNRISQIVSYAVSSRTDFSDGSERKIMLKIRLPDGKTVQISVNSSSIIAQVKEYIKQCIPSLADTNFSLYLIYPKRELQNEEPVNSEEINNAVLNLKM